MAERTISNVVVLGGGTSGWLTALYAKNNLPTKTITLIESEEIGILGAGEGSTPQLISLLDGLGIPVSRLIRETGATIKNGIKFTNWNNQGSKNFYYHGFRGDRDLDYDSACLDPHVSSAPSIFISALVVDNSIQKFDFVENISEEYKVPFVYSSDLVDPKNDRILDYYNVSSFSIHFDASLLAKLLKEIAIERGVVRVEGSVADVERDDTGDVKTLILSNGEHVSCDFVFDCSGFARFFPKLLGAEWHSHSPHLPVNAAIPFFLTMDKDNIPPYTESIAMKHGWMWKIPLQHRYGCGYVFDETAISVEEAINEVEEYLGHSISSPKTFRFEPGYFKNPWQNNVVSVGLSSGFIEPLEATSIWISIFYIKEILSSPDLMYSRDPRVSDDFNRYMSQLNDQVASFVYFHYMTGRDDTDFWRHFTKENAPNDLKKLLEVVECRLIKPRDVELSIWDLYSWYKIALGIGYPYVEDLMRGYDFYNSFMNLSKPSYLNYKANQEELAKLHCTSHKEFIDNLKEK